MELQHGTSECSLGASLGTSRAYSARSPQPPSFGIGNGCIMSEQRGNTGRRLGRRPTGDRCCLFAMELGGRWPSWMAPPLASRVLVQASQEAASVFATRVVRAIAAICRDDQSLETVVIAAGWVEDREQVLAARSRITQAVAKAMDGGPGSVLLSAHDLLPEEARHELLSTAGALAAQLAGSSIEIRVRFDSEPSVVRASPGSYGASDVAPLGSPTLAGAKATRVFGLATA